MKGKNHKSPQLGLFAAELCQYFLGKLRKVIPKFYQPASEKESISTNPSSANERAKIPSGPSSSTTPVTNLMLDESTYTNGDAALAGFIGDWSC